MKLRKMMTAILLHGKTLQQIAETTLSAGTEYQPESEVTDPLGQEWVRIVVDGYLYQVLKSEL